MQSCSYHKMVVIGAETDRCIQTEADAAVEGVVGLDIVTGFVARLWTAAPLIVKADRDCTLELLHSVVAVSEDCRM